METDNEPWAMDMAMFQHGRKILSLSLQKKEKMPHSFNKIWIHAIWATKKREYLIIPEIEQVLYTSMRDEFMEAGCPVRIINGMPEHVHCLFLLNPKKSIAEIIKIVKGSTSHFINRSNLIPQKFAWQTGYAAFSVNESTMKKVFYYIKNQKEHHKKQNFQEEYDAYLKLYGFDPSKKTKYNPQKKIA